MASNYFAINKQTWNNKTQVHTQSQFYNNQAFLNGLSSLNDIELGLLGDVKGKKILHLQCHFGQDTISLARMGAEVTGVDFSDKAIDVAKGIASELNVSAKFICCNVLDLPNALNEKFDIIFSSYGVIGWLPDLNKWANVISTFLKPSGKLILVEFHPFIWMFDNQLQNITYSYFNDEPIIETETGTYADKQDTNKYMSITWNHPISDVLTALLKQNFTLQIFNEFNYSPYNCFESMEEFEPKKFRIKSFENKLPLVYALEVIKLKH